MTRAIGLYIIKRLYSGNSTPDKRLTGDRGVAYYPRRLFF